MITRRGKALIERRSASLPVVLGVHGGAWAVLSAILLVAWWLPYASSPFEICTMKRWSGIPCPFCGSTRSFAAAAKGDVAWAWTNSPLATLLFYSTCVAWLWNLGALSTRSLWLPGRWFKPPVLTTRKVCWILISAVSANYAYRLMNGLY